MLKTLVKKQLLELFQSYFINRRTGKAKSFKEIISFFLLFIGLLGILGIAFYNIGISVGEIVLNKIDWLYFSIFGLLSIALGLFASVFNTYSSLYLPKDNDLLLSLPIPRTKIIVSRLIGVYSISLLYSAWIWIPITIAYYKLVSLTFIKVIFPIISLLIISLFVTILSTILGFLIALIASKTKNNNFLKVFFSLFIMGAYYVVYFKIQDILVSMNLYADKISSFVKTWLHYIYKIGEASSGNTMSMLEVIITTLILAIICFYIIVKTFTNLSLANDNSRKVTNKNLIYKKINPTKALLLREYKHFTSVSTWMLNSGFGLLIMIIASIAILIKKDSLLTSLNVLTTELPMYSMGLPILLLLGICTIISISSILASSISLEGKTLWIIKSLPVSTLDIFKSKEKMYIQMVMIASLPLIIISGVIFKFNLFSVLLICTGVFLYTYINADFSLLLNIKNPDMNWTNEMNVVKQSTSVVICLFSGMAFSLLMGYLGMSVIEYLNINVILLIFVFVFLIILIIIHNLLINKGTKLFNDL